MKLKIAVCDDDLQWSERIRQSISEYMCHVNQQCDIQVFESGEELCGAFHGSHSFDIVFLDPPYNSGLAKKALEAVFEKDVLNEGAIVVLERDEPDAVTSDLAVLVKEKKYGRTHIGIYTKKTQTAESGGNGE